MKLNRPQEAEETYLTALKYDSENADIYYNVSGTVCAHRQSEDNRLYSFSKRNIRTTYFQLGVVLLEQQRGQEALPFFNNALKYNPDHRVCVTMSRRPQFSCSRKCSTQP